VGPSLARRLTPDQKRHLLADWVRSVEPHVTGRPTPRRGLDSATKAVISKLTPRLRELLGLLLAGEGEKQIARQLSISRHTVHAHVKALYAAFQASSRAELLARFVAPPVLQGVSAASALTVRPPPGAATKPQPVANRVPAPTASPRSRRPAPRHRGAVANSNTRLTAAQLNGAAGTTRPAVAPARPISPVPADPPRGPSA
jgi:DNA-binding CsgD family transcriptional regulator